MRWLHLVTGIAWIGASLYFVFLDDSLEKPRDPADAAAGVGGELWAVHGGGFYHAQKYAAAPPAMPETLHWFKWEAYWTWISGFALLVLSYYLAADLYLIDRSVMDLSAGSAVVLGLAWLAAGWIVYDLLCKSPLGRNDAALGVVMFALLSLAAWGLTRTFSGRGAYIHFGAILGTIMVANVAMVIMPGQRQWVRALAEGRAPDPAAGALIRVWFVLRHKGEASPAPLAAGVLILAAVAILIAPRAEKGASDVKFAAVKQIVDARCVTCHAQSPTFQGFAQPPKGVMLDTAERIRSLALPIHQQTVLSRVMPPGNLTGITDDERQLIDRWYRAGAKID